MSHLLTFELSYSQAFVKVNITPLQHAPIPFIPYIYYSTPFPDKPTVRIFIRQKLSKWVANQHIQNINVRKWEEKRKTWLEYLCLGIWIGGMIGNKKEIFDTQGFCFRNRKMGWNREGGGKNTQNQSWNKPYILSNIFTLYNKYIIFFLRCWPFGITYDQSMISLDQTLWI